MVRSGSVGRCFFVVVLGVGCALFGASCDYFGAIEEPSPGAAEQEPVPCSEVTCSPGQTCDSETGECGVVQCGFTNERDRWSSTCLDGEVCHLDPNGDGYCAAPCDGDGDCVSSGAGSSCEQKYRSAVGGGICVPDDVANVSCFDARYEGLCLSDEFCECDGESCSVGLCVAEDASECGGVCGGVDL